MTQEELIGSCRYYKGEKDNPFEEINENQGAWCNRYNQIASVLWFFEYHWVNGLDKYNKLPDRIDGLYFTSNSDPLKEFDSLETALCAFIFSLNYPWAGTTCRRWCNYIYENALNERFFKPLGHIVPANEMPSYLKYYHGEIDKPIEYLGTQKYIFWDLELNWYKNAERITKSDFERYREAYLMRDSIYTDHNSAEYKDELKNKLDLYLIHQ